MSIDRRQFIGAAGAALFAGALGSAVYLLKHQKPNFIVFVGSRLRHDAFGFAGSKLAWTPHFDRLAEDGVVFTNCYTRSTNPIISRFNILTGKPHYARGEEGADRILPGQFLRIYPVMLEHRGYHTGYIGKWDDKDDLTRRFRYWKTNTSPSAENIFDQQKKFAQEFLRTVPQDKKFLLIISLDGMDIPFSPQPRFDPLFKGVNAIRMPTHRPKWRKELPPLLASTQDYVDFAKYVGSGGYRDTIKKYHALVSGVDDVMGGVLDTLKDTNLYDDTCIFFSSSTGMLLGEHGLFGNSIPFESALRVPLIVKPPLSLNKNVDKRKVDKLVSNIDIAPTLLDLADEPVGSHGYELSAHLGVRYPSYTTWEPNLVFGNPGKGGLGYNGLVSGRWKYVIFRAKGKKLVEWLYDLKYDPLETRNLATNQNYNRLKGRLKSRLHKKL